MLKSYIRRLGIALSLAWPLVAMSSQQLSAQRADADFSDSLLNAGTCVMSGVNSNYSRIFSNPEAVSISRQVFNRAFTIGAVAGESSLLSCNVNPEQFGLVSLRMGAGDESISTGAVMRVNVYHGGNLKHTYNGLRAGSSAVNVLLDLEDPLVANNPGSFAVEIASCVTDGRRVCYLHFVEAELHPASGIAGGFSGNAISSPVYSAPPMPTQQPVNNSQPISPTPSHPPSYNPSHPRPPWQQ